MNNMAIISMESYEDFKRINKCLKIIMCNRTRFEGGIAFDLESIAEFLAEEFNIPKESIYFKGKGDVLHE